MAMPQMLVLSTEHTPRLTIAMDRGRKLTGGGMKLVAATPPTVNTARMIRFIVHLLSTESTPV